jgi:predicted exporter
VCSNARAGFLFFPFCIGERCSPFFAASCFFVFFLRGVMRASPRESKCQRCSFRPRFVEQISVQCMHAMQRLTRAIEDNEAARVQLRVVDPRRASKELHRTVSRTTSKDVRALPLGGVVGDSCNVEGATLVLLLLLLNRTCGGCERRC